MEELIRMFGALKFLLTDNGSEFIAKALVRWLKDQDVQSRFIDPRSPWQNGRSERSNGTLRNELLNQEVFHHVDHARALVRLYLGKYNTERPHSRLNYRPPLEFALGQGMKVRRDWYGSGNLARLRGLCPHTSGIYRIGPPGQDGTREVVSRLP
jgi:IS30 family transposase